MITTGTSTVNNASGMDLYQNRIIIRDDDGTGTIPADLENYDKEDDTDILFTVEASPTLFSFFAAAK